MSGVSLTSASVSATPTVRPNDPLANVLPGPPTTTREFERADNTNAAISRECSSGSGGSCSANPPYSFGCSVALMLPFPCVKLY